MLRIFALALVIAVSGCAAPRYIEPNESLLQTGFRGLPADAAQVAERLAGCNHFAGETGDNPPEREQQIAEAIQELHCDRIGEDVAAIRAKYPGNAKVQEALAAADQL